MALVLAAKTKRDGSIKSFDVKAIGDSPEAALESIAEGNYHVLDGSTVKEATVSYRVVQDIEYK